MTLELLFAIDPAVRLGRITAQTAPLDRPLVFALREVVLFDEDAGVRASAAAALGRGDVETASAPLVDALYDSHPSVRAAACRALGRVGCRPAPDVLRRLAFARHKEPQRVVFIDLRVLRGHRTRVQVAVAVTGGEHAELGVLDQTPQAVTVCNLVGHGVSWRAMNAEQTI